MPAETLNNDLTFYGHGRSMYIGDMTRDGFKASADRDAVVIVPWGACEAHGPHLPLDTDTLQPVHVASEVAARLEGVLVAPPVNYALHSSTRDMPGTLTVSFDTVRGIAYDLVISLWRQGIDRTVILAGHAGSGHISAILEGCKTAVRETGTQVIFLSDWHLSTEYDGPEAGAEEDGHAGRAETSRILAIRPDLVGDLDRKTGDFRHTYRILRDGSLCLPDGYQGDISGASAEFGRKLNDYIVGRVIGIIGNDFE